MQCSYILNSVLKVLIRKKGGWEVDEQFISWFWMRIWEALVQFSAVQLHFKQCPFPNQIQFGLEKLHPKIAYNFPNQFQFGLERKKLILQDTDSKPNSDWFGKFWWPLSMSWKFQTKFSLVWKNHWLLPTPWTLNQFQFYFVKSHFRKKKHSNIQVQD